MSEAISSRRIETFDLLRGYFLLVILIDHLGHFPIIFELVTGRGELWASAAEGFFIISGLLLGHLRGQQIRAGKTKLVRSKLLRRSLLIFGWSVGLTLVFTIAGNLLLGTPGLKAGLDATSPWWMVVFKTITFQYVYGWADFLMYYAVYLALAPLALHLMVRRLTWVVVALVAGAWLLRSNSFFGWQAYFFLAMVVGYNLRRIEAWAAQMPAALARRVTWALGVATLATIALSAALVHGPNIISLVFSSATWTQVVTGPLEMWGNVVNPWFDKWSLAPARLAVAALWFTALYVVIRRHEAWFVRRLGALFMPVGRHSLMIYGAQSVIVFALSMLSPQTLGLWLNSLIGAGCLAVVWALAVWLDRRSRRAHRRAQTSAAR